ncbi:(-)-germacrene D synthase-like isoform X2 [Rhodamnia argentea]|uniref:(-)-germacrene D synthase-like isoform X2 n=1 Tax=Rhodamnia argentea TaxID=178133 RepID=A0A8B8NN28_9MYRT|nr:(-)-germacrene D synthase-like isoform X2 [Rhodamnia argentea]
MSLQISAIPSSSAQDASQFAVRRSANFHPGIWGDYFLKYASDSSSMSSHAIAEDRIERLKGEVSNMLKDATAKPSQKLNLIDQIQRLGIAYHFEIEIDQQLEQIQRSYSGFHCGDNNDLHTVALLFRLLRQHGYTISSAIFNKFKDNKGNFSESLIADVQGLLSLFEACHLRSHGDDILDNAIGFTVTHLKSTDKGKPNPNLGKQVRRALNQPIHKGMPRLEARHYIPLYQENPLHNEVMLSLAKLDFNILQGQHQKELGNLTRWWKDLEVERKLPFARDRLVEMYLWMSGVYFEPEYETARVILTKVGILVSIIDDIYDVHGTLEELELFTEAIERWDVNAKDGLPEYMQACYKIVLDLYDEIGYEMTRNGRSYRLFYAKEAMKNQVRAYFAEAKWFHQNHVPMMEEYMPIALASSALEVLPVTSFLEMGDIVTKDVFDWLLYSNPKMAKAVKVVGRLMDDIAGHKFEQERGHGATSVECFMKQYGVTDEVAKEELRKQVADAWKDINEGLRRPAIVPRPILTRILNFARAMHVVYKDEIDLYTHAETTLKMYVTSLYVDPLPM